MAEGDRSEGGRRWGAPARELELEPSRAPWPELEVAPSPPPAAARRRRSEGPPARLPAMSFCSSIPWQIRPAGMRTARAATVMDGP